MTDDLISRAALLAAYDAAHKGPPGGARKLMENAPAVDAVPVVHAQWKQYDNEFGYVICSNCRDMVVDKELMTEVKWAYCPNCGAKMYEEKPACGPDYCEIGGGDDAR